MKPIPVALDGIPTEMREVDQWICWWSVTGEGKPVRLPGGRLTKPLEPRPKPHKVPINPHTGGPGKTNDPTTWGTFSEAVEAYTRVGVSGVGFVFTAADDFVGVDLDNCRDRDSGAINAHAMEIISTFNSYTEVSPSDTGLKIIVRATREPGSRHRTKYDGGEIEWYVSGRYFTVTGSHLTGTPLAVESRQEELQGVYDRLFVQTERKPAPAATTRSAGPAIRPESASVTAEQTAVTAALRANLTDLDLLEKARRSHVGARFSALYDGDASEYGDDQSRADMALCNYLSFWCRDDAAWMDALFRQSRLMRPKWDEPHSSDGSTYGQMTIRKAVNRPHAIYDPNYGQPDSAQNNPPAVSDEPAHANTVEGDAPAEAQTSPVVSPPSAPTTDVSIATAPASAATEPESASATIVSRMASYPAPIGPAAYLGVVGDFVRGVEPHTEADSSVLLLLFLAYVGNLTGRDFYLWIGGQKHHSNIFVNVVGTTSTGRKGSASGPLDLFFGQVDPPWAENAQSGLSSGEGLIWCVRDRITKREKDKKTGEYDEVEVDPGVDDKRALVKQPEFFGALQVMRRSGNTLSPVIREAWDNGNLRSMTKNSPARATNAHITIIGNITKEELLRGMLGGEMDNGFANRFLWACSKRSKALPEGGRLHEVMDTNQWHDLVLRVQKAKAFAFQADALFRDTEASDYWGRDGRPDDGAYFRLTRERHGLFGAATSRAAPQVLRLALIYAMLDRVREIRIEHLKAALEVWRYCEDSAKYIFGDSMGDPTADSILNGLRQQPAGLTRKEISDLFAGNVKTAEIQRALDVLNKAGLARFELEKRDGKGRNPERWLAVGQIGARR